VIILTTVRISLFPSCCTPAFDTRTFLAWPHYQVWLEMLQTARLEAYEHGWRRPWDGTDGEAFHAWSLKHELKLSGVRVASDPDPFVKPEVLHVLNVGACLCVHVCAFLTFPFACPLSCSISYCFHIASSFYVPFSLFLSLSLSRSLALTIRSLKMLRFSLFHCYFLVYSISLSLTHYRAKTTTTNKTNSIGTTPNFPKAARRWADLGWTNTTAKHICAISRR